MRTRSRWSEGAGVLGGPALGAVLLALQAGLAPSPVAAQDDEADAACAGFLSPSAVAECRLSVGAARVVQPRLGVAIFGGNPVPGTASTLGMRIASLPRLSLAFRVTGAPATLLPIEDRSSNSANEALLLGFAADGAIGILPGFSPLPTVGGVLSLDLIARAGYVLLPGDGFHDGGAWGWALGARVGALRESFTLPGVSATASYGRISRTGVGDPEDAATAGFFDGAVTDLRLGAAATKRLGLIGLTGGVAWDRYSSDLRAGFRESFGGPQLVVEGTAVHNRWTAYANAAFTLLIFQAALEAGWQEAETPAGIPSSVSADPAGWFGGFTFRISI